MGKTRTERKLTLSPSTSVATWCRSTSPALPTATWSSSSAAFPASQPRALHVLRQRLVAQNGAFADKRATSETRLPSSSASISSTAASPSPRSLRSSRTSPDTVPPSRMTHSLVESTSACLAQRRCISIKLQPLLCRHFPQRCRTQILRRTLLQLAGSPDTRKLSHPEARARLPCLSSTFEKCRMSKRSAVRVDKCGAQRSARDVASPSPVTRGF